uniref:Uncharacterized protein n=1 Tax=Sphaeramia orbicularis TaxID=375764 RepID=A0A672ZBP4_9TELE
VMSSQPQGGAEPSCGCKASSSSLIGGSGAGWEGTALLHHGSYIKLGCLQFVFSITEFASKQPKDEPFSKNKRNASVLRLCLHYRGMDGRTDGWICAFLHWKKSKSKCICVISVPNI